MSLESLDRALEGRRHLDLVEETRAQLVVGGVLAEQIHDSGVCTYRESFRRERGGVGRMFGVVGLRETFS